MDNYRSGTLHAVESSVLLQFFLACNAGVFWRASARILIGRAPSWIKTRKRRKGVLGSRDEAEKGVTGVGEGKENYILLTPPAPRRSLVLRQNGSNSTRSRTNIYR